MNRKAAMGLSGGVDSAVAAAVLVEQGYDVTGVFLECWKEPGCRTDADRKDALSVALKLKIPFKVLDFKEEYRQKVVDYFYDEYKAGRTPNPDVMCNKEIKFGLFYDWCLENGFDFVATGHYARIRDKNLLRGMDEKKDQSYFLYRLRQEQLIHILFPVGEMTKVQVRQEAKKRGLPVADKPDSQGICFIGEVNIQQLLRQRLPVKIGEVVDTRGQVIGEHDGVWFYTIGQRHGFKTNSKLKIKNAKFSDRPPLYVIKKDIENNRLVVGFGAETYRDQFTVSDVNWLHPPCKATPCEAKVRIRHGGELIPAKLKIGNCLPASTRLWQAGKLKIGLAEPQRGVAPGQSAVFYLPADATHQALQAGNGDVVLGGGIID